MQLHELEELLKKKAAKKLKEDLEKSFHNLILSWGPKNFSLMDKVNLHNAGGVGLSIDMALKEIELTVFNKMLPSAEKAACANFLANVESLQKQLDDFSSQG